MSKCCENCKHSHECARHVFSLPIEDVRKWCNTRRKEQNLTMQNIADMANVPFGTVARFFSSDQSEFRYTTTAPIVASLIEYGDCPMQFTDWSNTPENENEDIIRTLEFNCKMQRILIYILCGALSIMIMLTAIALIVDYFTANGFFWH